MNDSDDGDDDDDNDGGDDEDDDNNWDDGNNDDNVDDVNCDDDVLIEDNCKTHHDVYSSTPISLSSMIG